MQRLNLTRTIQLPDPVKLARYRHCPDLGPKILFFSGGTALRNTSLELIEYTHNSIHIITPFDSGGSSAKLRDAFHMPAIGDIRNRLLALADRSLHGNPEIFRLFAHRFPEDGVAVTLAHELDRMIDGTHELVQPVPDPMRKIIRRHLDLFKEFMPPIFDLRKASIGNLVLAAGYLENRRNFDTIIFIFSKLVQVRGVVRPVVNQYLHLVTELENGETLVGQHLLTGKEVSPIRSKVARIRLTDAPEGATPVNAEIREKMHQLIGSAELICYPFGSFYSSLLANLLPRGVGTAVENNPCPKIFIPSTGAGDPETWGMTPTDQVLTLLDYLRKDDPKTIRPEDVLNFVLVDRNDGNYSEPIDRKRLGALGIQVISAPLVTETSAPLIDEKRLVPLILSLT